MASMTAKDLYLAIGRIVFKYPDAMVRIGHVYVEPETGAMKPYNNPTNSVTFALDRDLNEPVFVIWDKE